mgnify:CR=1 FL=1
MSNIIKVQASFYLEVSDKLAESLSMRDYDVLEFVLSNCFKNNTRRVIEADFEHLLDTSDKNNTGDFSRICDSLEELKRIGINFSDGTGFVASKGAING